MNEGKIKFVKSFGHAFNGIRVAIREQRNLKVQATIAALTLVAGFYFDIPSVEWCVILLTIALVMALEMVNSALENVVDLITRDQHPLAGKAKDIAAGAVFFASIIATVIGAIIFAKYIFP
jgi:diacylglycerol kinase